MLTTTQKLLTVKSPGTDPGKFTRPIDEDSKPVIEEIPLRYLTPSPYQPRKIFDEAALQELAASLTAAGTNRTLLIVRLLAGMTYEIIAGERRWRAAKLAGLPALRCEVRTLTDTEARRLCRQENLERKDLTDVERVTAYREMLADGDYPTQAALAAALGLTPAALSNQLRVLDLPQYFLDLVSQEKLGLTHLRALATWVDRPSVLAEAERSLKEDREDYWSVMCAEHFNGGDLPSPTVMQFEEFVSDCVREVSRPIDGKQIFENHHDLSGNRIRITETDLPTPAMIKKDHDTLDVIDCGKQLGRRAFNLDVWNALSTAATAKRAKGGRAKGGRGSCRADEDEDGSAGASPSPKKPKRSAAEQRQLDEQQARTYQRHLYTYKIQWLQRAIVARLATADHATLVWHHLAWSTGGNLSGMTRGETLGEAAIAAGGRQRARNASSTSIWPTLLTVIAITADDITDQPVDILLRNLLTAWYSLDMTKWARGVDELFIEQSAAQLMIDFASDWKLDREFLELHTTEQLNGLITEWKLPRGDKANPKRGELITAITEIYLDSTRTERPIAFPKCLLKLKSTNITR